MRNVSGTFGASDIECRQLALGDFHGHLSVVDMSRPGEAVYTGQAHTNIINCIDGVGGLGVGAGNCRCGSNNN